MSEQKTRFRPPLKRKSVEVICNKSPKQSPDLVINKDIECLKIESEIKNVAKSEVKDVVKNDAKKDKGFVFTVANGKTSSVSAKKIRRMADKINKDLEEEKTDGQTVSIDSSEQLVPEVLTKEESEREETVDNNSGNGLLFDDLFLEELINDEDFN